MIGRALRARVGLLLWQILQLRSAWSRRSAPHVEASAPGKYFRDYALTADFGQPFLCNVVLPHQESNDLNTRDFRQRS